MQSMKKMKLEKLETLNLFDNNVQDQGFAHLIETYIPNIIVINLSKIVFTKRKIRSERDLPLNAYAKDIGLNYYSSTSCKVIQQKKGSHFIKLIPLCSWNFTVKRLAKRKNFR